eukprot:TRINITY_DN20217_c0_g1_i1.p1 TRINITY_DN20217_c0_g1~~TRINITY_DN20217_c0_g1_i1.p1  ORF type:complete len:300 (+),score=72.49 TRINITY_DN20217_c0_g1_i1:464-1363(+)
MEHEDDYDNDGNEWEDATPATAVVGRKPAVAKKSSTAAGSGAAPEGNSNMGNPKTSKNTKPQQGLPPTTPAKTGGVKRKAGTQGAPGGTATGGGGKTPAGKVKKGDTKGGSLEGRGSGPGQQNRNETGGHVKHGGHEYDEEDEGGGAAGEEEEGAERAGERGGNAGKEEEEVEGGDSLLDVDMSRIPTMNAEKMRHVLKRFTPEQMDRYEAFRRSGFQRSNMRRLVQTVAGCQVTVHMAIVMSGITKIFVGELVDAARGVMSERNETGPIRPGHIRAAFSRLRHDGKLPTRSRPPLLLR